MSKPFLRQVAGHYFEEGTISEKCFIFPNRRSMAFFKKHLAEFVASRGDGGHPCIVPEMFTINDFFSRLSPLRQASRVKLLAVLYECYRKLYPKAEPLDEFIFWGDVLLGDFNDTDKYLANPRQLFTNVSDFKTIQDNYDYLTENQRNAIESFIRHFSDRSGRLTVDLGSENPNVKERFIQIWNILHDLYTSFNSVLREEGIAYEGMIYRDVAEQVGAQSAEDVLAPVFGEGRRFVTVGLNALNECEKTVLKKMRDASLAEFCWDYSGEMISDPANKSSFFLSRNIKEFPQSFNIDPEGVRRPKINVVAVPSSVGQAKQLPWVFNSIASGAPVSEIPVQEASSDASVKEISGAECSEANLGVSLAELSKGGEGCAVVIPDESLLQPVLNSIPPEINDINVTMGCPMGGSDFHNLMCDVASMQLHGTKKAGTSAFYHRQVWSVFSSSVLRRAVDPDSEEIIKAVRKAAKYYVPASDLRGTPLFDVIFRPLDLPDEPSADNASAFADYLATVVKTIASALAGNPETTLEMDFAKEYYLNVNLLKQMNLEIRPKTFTTLLDQLMAGVSVPFEGEPLKGLQIMGPLETRALDFRNVIILSANEGIFPKRNVSSSFIPPELRKGFGLPTYEYQDAVWAYYFYRLISRAETVWLLYDSRTEGLKSGEESRYIKQLQYHFNADVTRYAVKGGRMAVKEMPEIKKTQEHIEHIRNFRFSASSVQNYLTCPAKFYYSAVEEIRPEDEVAETLDSGMFGTVYHETMRAFYLGDEAMAPSFDADTLSVRSASGDGALKVTRQRLTEWLGRKKDIRAKVNSLIMKQLNTTEISGRNLVVSDVIVKYVLRTIETDLERMEGDSFEIHGLELRLYGKIAGRNFTGIIDRLDSMDPDVLRIVDYKTGKVLPFDENINDATAEIIAGMIFEKDIKDRPKIALQCFIYDELLRQNRNLAGKHLANCIYSTARLFKEKPAETPENRLFSRSVTEKLAALFDEMENPDIPFSRTERRESCSYCDFKIICGR